MAHTPKPFYRSARNAFYCQLGKQQIKLVSGPNDSATGKLAWAAFHALMVERAANDDAPTPISANSATPTAAEVFEKFLDWCQKHRSPRTYFLARKHIQSFCDHLKTARTLLAADLRPFHVVEWADSNPAWGPNEKRNRIGNITRAYNWVEKLGYVSANPIRGVEKPSRTKRDSTMTHADFVALLEHIDEGDPFRDLITFAYEAGCRPQEARLIEARHLKPEHHRVEIPPKEAKGKKRWRVVYLSDAALAIAKRLAEARPTGSLFRNADGNPWKAQAIVCRFQRLLVKMSGAEEELPNLPRFQGFKIANPVERAAAKAVHVKSLAEVRKERAKFARNGTKRFSMYDLRHLFATRKLKEGHDPITVATLLGHKDTGMLARHYQELSKDYDHLLSAANGPKE